MSANIIQTPNIHSAETEEDLKKNNEIYRLLIENISDYITLIDLTGRYIYASPSHTQMGYTPQELVGKSAIAMVHSEDRAELLPLLMKFAKKLATAKARTLPTIKTEASTLRLKFRFPDKSGKWHYLETIPNVVENIKGHRYAVLLISRDVTAGKKEQEALKESEERYRCVVDNAKDVIFRLSTDGILTSLNPAFEKVTGWPRSQWIGRSFKPLVHHDDLESSIKIYKSVIGGGTSPSFELRILCRSGDYLPSEFTFAHEISNGKITGGIGIARDISDRRTSQDELSKFKLGLELSNDAVFMTRLDGTIIYVNPSFEKLYGYSRNEAIGKTPRILKSGLLQKSVYKQFWDTLLEKKVVSSELVNKTKDGRMLKIESSSNPILDKSGNITGFLAIQRDITERKKMAEKLSETKKLLENIAQGITDEVLLISKDYRILWANRAAMENRGCDTKEILGSYCYKITHHRESPCKPPHDLCPATEVIKTGIPVSVTHTHYDKAGHERFVEVTAYPIKDEKGKIIQFVHLARDVTDRKKFEEELKRTKSELESKVSELERYNKLFVGRELKMIELKKRIADLEKRKKND